MASSSMGEIEKRSLHPAVNHQMGPTTGEDSQKEVEFGNAKEYTYDVHIAHILAVRHFTKTNLINFVRTKGLLEDTNSVLDEEKWKKAHKRVAEGSPRSHGTFTLRHKLWNTLDPEDYPYSDESRKLALYNIAKNLKSKDGSSKNLQKPKIPRGKFFKKQSTPSSKETKAPNKKRDFSNSSKAIGSSIKDQSSGTQQKVAISKPNTPATNPHHPTIGLVSSEKPTDDQNLLVQEDLRKDSSLQVEPSQKRSLPDINETNTSVKRQKVSENSQSFQPPVVNQHFESQQAVTVTKPNTVSTSSNQLSISSTVPSTKPTNDNLPNTIATAKSLILPNNSPDVLSEGHISNKPIKVNPKTGRPFAYAKRGGGSLRGRSSTSRKAPSQDSDHSSTSSESDHDLNSSLLTDSLQQIQATSTQSFTTLQVGTDNEIEVQKRDIEIAKSAPQAQKIQAALDSTQRDLKAREDQCRELRFDLEKALGELTRAGEHIKTLDAQILELRGKLNDANTTIVKWVDEDEKMVRARKEHMAL